MKCKNGFLTVLSALVSLVLLLLPFAQVKGDECPHQWVMVSTTPATCTESGHELYRCSLCAAEKRVTLPALGHVWSYCVTIKKATCTEDGLIRCYCARDNTHYKDSVEPARGHTWGNWHTTKQATLNGVKQTAATGFIGRFCAVVFSPDNMSLVKGGSNERRRFLDAAISQQFPTYPRLLVEYNRILAQRNAFLKKSGSTAGFESMLEIWDENLSQTGARISVKRAEYVSRLEGKTAGIFDGISSGRDSIKLRYSCSYLNPESINETVAALRKQLETHRASDLSQGCTNYGAHRDDLHISVNDMAARVYASQGQKRSCVLALKLAEASLLEESAGERPIAVLDDVMSELDGLRQDYLLNQMDGWQVFISCCDPYTVKGLDKGRIIEVEGGRFSVKSRG